MSVDRIKERNAKTCFDLTYLIRFRNFIAYQDKKNRERNISLILLGYRLIPTGVESIDIDWRRSEVDCIIENHVTQSLCSFLRYALFSVSNDQWSDLLIWYKTSVFSDALIDIALHKSQMKMKNLDQIINTANVPIIHSYTNCNRLNKHDKNIKSKNVLKICLFFDLTRTSCLV